VIDLATGDVAFVEALLRWRDQGAGAMSPDVFIPVAEEAGLMPQIDAWVLDRACDDLARWHRDGTAVPKVSVNISRRSLTADLPALLATTLRCHGVAAAALCLEVTETSVTRDPVGTREILTRIRDLGVQVALDDFGTGQSSLSELATLPIDLVKLDQSFLRRVERDRALTVLTAVAGLCATLGLPVVIEGIDDATLVSDLRRSGCAYGQGYALGRPQHPDALGRRPSTAMTPPTILAAPTSADPGEIGDPWCVLHEGHEQAIGAGALR
jgi:EAL domain-containing protein (putative c-di-GMP-specific phosphodiesterase class I)